MQRFIVGLIFVATAIFLMTPAEATIRRWGRRWSSPGPQMAWAPAATAPAAPARFERAAAEPAALAQAPEKSLYERLGGEAAIKLVVDDFVGRAAGNPKVNFTRKGTNKEWAATPENVARLKMHLVDLIGMVTGGPQKYTGRSMKDSHVGMKITADEFGALAADLKATLDNFQVPAKEQMELLTIVGSTQGEIVEQK